VTISDSELEAGLRNLRTRADDIAPPPFDLAQQTRHRYRAQRRSRAALAAGGLVAALVFIGVPVAASTFAADPQRREVAGPSGRTFVPSPPTGLYALPTRGSLADDEGWLSDVTALEWDLPDPDAYGGGMELPDAPVDTRRVAFAGDIPSGRVALVLGMDNRHVVHAWFTGPAGADADELVLASPPSQAGPDTALALLDAPDATARSATLLVVAQPGDTVDRGLIPVVEASGEERAERVDVAVEDGIAVTEAPAPWPWASPGSDVRVRSAAGDDRPVQLEESERLRGGIVSSVVPPEVAPADPRGLAGRTDPEASSWSVGSVLANYGLTAEQAQPTLLAVGPLGSRVNRYGELYGMTHPSGATTTWLMTYSTGGPDTGVTSMQFSSAPAGTALLDRVIAVQADAGVLVSAPAGVQAQVLDAAGAVLVTVPLERGAGTAPYNGRQEGVTVRVLDGAGDVLAETTLTGMDG
jgi:hypothetical protein